MPAPQGIVVRSSPTYRRDVHRLRLDTATLDALGATIAEIVAALRQNPNNPDKVRAGTPIARDRHQTWKRRIGRPGASVGRRGGLRLIYWWRRVEREVVLLFLYSKTERTDILQKEIDRAKALHTSTTASS